MINEFQWLVAISLYQYKIEVNLATVSACSRGKNLKKKKFYHLSVTSSQLRYNSAHIFLAKLSPISFIVNQIPYVDVTAHYFDQLWRIDQCSWMSASRSHSSCLFTTSENSGWERVTPSDRLHLPTRDFHSLCQSLKTKCIINTVTILFEEEGQNDNKDLYYTDNKRNCSGDRN